MPTDLRVLLRGFVRSPGFTALAVISLALGIGLNTAVFSLINALFWQSIRGVPQPHRVVFGPRVSGVELARLRDGATTLEGLAGVARVPVQIAAGEVSVSEVVPAVSEDYFPGLHVTPRLGRLFDATLTQPGADIRVAVLDHRFWRDQMKSDPGVIGRVLTINGHPFTIAGVAPDGFHGAGPEGPPLWVPLSAWPLLIGQPSVLTDAAREDLALIGRLRDGRSLEDATAELNLLRQRAPHRHAGSDAGSAAATRPRRITLSAGRESWTAEPSPEKRVEFLLVTVVPLVIVAALLWIACSNVANLLLARGVGRRREIAIRLATGASRQRIVLLLLGETLLLALAGGALGVLVGGWTLDVVFATFSQFGAIDVSLDASVLAYTAAVSCLATVLAGLVPALEASRGDVSSVLKAEGTSLTVSVRGARLRAVFLTVQVAFALALLMVAGTFVRALVASHVGTDAARFDHLALAQVSLDPARAGAPAAIWDATRDALARTPGVRGVTVLSADATTAPALTAIDGRPVPAAPLTVQAIDAGFLQTADARIVHGRAATAPAAAAPSGAASAFEAPFEAVVNTAAARRIARQGEAVSPAVDRALTMGGVSARVVGVVEDGFTEARVYRPAAATTNASAVTFLVRTEAPVTEALAALRSTLAAQLPREARPMVGTWRDANLRGLGEISRVGALLGLLALLLAGAGVAGSMAFHGRQRAREIAVRRALGATTSAVLHLVAVQAARITAVGLALGLALGWVGTQGLLSLMGGAAWQIDWIATAGVAAIFAATIGFASLGPTWRALRLEPSSLLHTD
jgi:putative ABC transport system permease protein